MSPIMTALPGPVPVWTQDWLFPPKDLTNSVGGLPSNPGTVNAIGQQTWPWGADVTDVQYQYSTSSSAGSGAVATVRGGKYLARTGRTLEAGTGTGSCENRWRIPTWIPALDPATSPDDPEQRIMWCRLWVLAGGADTIPALANALGFGFVADNGAAFNTMTSVTGTGGWGIVKRNVAGGEFAWGSFGAAGVLLENIDLPSAAGWHTADLIVRQARRGDATTPWLSLRWDGQRIFDQRTFGDPLLVNPIAAAADAHGWGFAFGCSPVTGGQMSFYARIRIGMFHPDGYIEPA